MNWQEFDRGMQMNEAMFVGEEGWVVKPEGMRSGEAGGSVDLGRKTRIGIEVLGLSGRESSIIRVLPITLINAHIPVPHHQGDTSFSVRIRVQLFHALGECDWSTKPKKCKITDPNEGADAFFVDERVDWSIDQDELAFLRCVRELLIVLRYLSDFTDMRCAL
jgi:phosphatidylinositol phospholipase C delta